MEQIGESQTVESPENSQTARLLAGVELVFDELEESDIRHCMDLAIFNLIEEKARNKQYKSIVDVLNNLSDDTLQSLAVLLEKYNDLDRKLVGVATKHVDFLNQFFDQLKELDN